MFEAFIIWLYLSIGSVLQILNLITTIALVLIGISFIFTFLVSEVGSPDDKNMYNVYQKVKSLFKPVFISFLVVVCLKAVYPDKEDLKWIIGGALVWNGVQAASDIEGVRELPQNTVDAMNHFLKSIQEEGEVNDQTN